MDMGIAVDFAGGRLKNLNLEILRQLQHVHGAEDARLHRLDRVELIMDRRGRQGEIIDFIDLDVEGSRDVAARAARSRDGPANDERFVF